MGYKHVKMVEKPLQAIGFNSASDQIKLHDTPASSHQLLDDDHDGYGKPKTQDRNYFLVSVV